MSDKCEHKWEGITHTTCGKCWRTDREIELEAKVEDYEELKRDHKELLEDNKQQTQGIIYEYDLRRKLEAKVSGLTIKSRVVAECEQEYRDLYKFLQIWFEKLGLSIPDDDALLQWGDNLDEVDLLKRKEAQK